MQLQIDMRNIVRDFPLDETRLNVSSSAAVSNVPGGADRFMNDLEQSAANFGRLQIVV